MKKISISLIIIVLLFLTITAFAPLPTIPTDSYICLDRFTAQPKAIIKNTSENDLVSIEMLDGPPHTWTLWPGNTMQFLLLPESTIRVYIYQEEMFISIDPEVEYDECSPHIILGDAIKKIKDSNEKESPKETKETLTLPEQLWIPRRDR